jgi:hypothetical protein
VYALSTIQDFWGKFSLISFIVIMSLQRKTKKKRKNHGVNSLPDFLYRVLTASQTPGLAGCMIASSPPLTCDPRR